MNRGSGKSSWEVSHSGKSATYGNAGASGTSATYGNAGALIGRPVEQPQSYERISRAKYEDKQTGSYERYTTKEKASSGERHVERGSRQVGVRDEVKTSSTVKVGDRSGYTEYQVEERVRRVDFGRSSITNGPNNYASYGRDDNAAHRTGYAVVTAAPSYDDNNAAHRTGYAVVNAAPSYDYGGGYSDADY